MNASRPVTSWRGLASCNSLAASVLKLSRAEDANHLSMDHRGITNARAEGSKFSQGVAAFMLLLFLSVQLLAAVPVLHHALHHDAASSEHQCAVTLLTSGQIDCASAPLAAPTPSVSVEAHQTFTTSCPSLTPCRLLAGRAPPVLA